MRWVRAYASFLSLSLSLSRMYLRVSAVCLMRTWFHFISFENMEMPYKFIRQCWHFVCIISMRLIVTYYLIHIYTVHFYFGNNHLIPNTYAEPRAEQEKNTSHNKGNCEHDFHERIGKLSNRKRIDIATHIAVDLFQMILSQYMRMVSKETTNRVCLSLSRILYLSVRLCVCVCVQCSSIHLNSRKTFRVIS